MFSDWGFSWGGWLDNRRGEWWLLAQLLLITAHLRPAWPAPANFGVESWPPPLFGLGLLLLAFGCWLLTVAAKKMVVSYWLLLFVVFMREHENSYVLWALGPWGP